MGSRFWGDPFDVREDEAAEAAEIEQGKDLVQLKNVPFDLDLKPNGFPVCHPDDIIASKVAAHRRKDQETLPRLMSFRDYWKQKKSS